MAQHDYVIDNSTGANVRADINSVLQAIASNNSGSSAPSTTYAFQFFADTANNIMKIRNSNNTGFIELFQLDGTFTLEDGSNSSPALAFRDDLNTGIFSGGADEFNIATAGIERFVINSSGNCGVGLESPAAKLAVHTSTSTDSSSQLFRITTANGALFGIETDETSSNPTWKIGGLVNSGAAEPLAFYQLGSEVARIDSSGRLLLGTSSQLSSSSERPLQIQDTGGPKIALGRNDTSISDGNTIGGIEFYGNDSDGTFVNTASITVNADGTHGNNDKPTRMQFFTTNDNGSSPTERMRIKSNGNVGLSTTTPTERLHVSGNILASGTITPNSDIAFKKDIKPLTNVLNKVTQLLGINFTYKNNNEKSMGLLAQDVEKVFPELIRGEEGNKSLNYMGLTGALIEAIKELSAKVEALEAT